MASALLENLSAASALATTDLFYVKQAGARGLKATGTQLLALVGTAYVPLAGGTMTGALTLPAGTTESPSLKVGAGETGLSSTSAANLTFSVNGTRIGYSGTTNIWLEAVLGFLDNTGSLRWGSLSTADPMIKRFSDGGLYVTQASATGACSFRIAGLSTDSSNYEYLALSTTAGTSVNITAETLGTGGDNLDIVLTPAGTGRLVVPGGSASNPGIAISGALTTGLFSTAATNLQMIFVGTTGLFASVSAINGNSGTVFGWSSTGYAQATADAGISRNGVGVVEVNNGTAGTYRDLKLRNLLAGGGNGSYVQTPSMTVDRLADAATAGAGARAFVTDANATTFLSTVAGGGSNKVPVVSNGTNWLIG